MKKYYKSIYIVLGVFLLWRFFLFILGWFADIFLVYAPSFPYANGILDSFSLPRWLFSWAGFDGVHYLTIMLRGYHGAGLIQAFFPFYPYLSKIFGSLIDNYLIGGLLVSNLSFLALIYVWYRFVKLNYSKKVALWSTVALLLFPTSLFFGALYSESLFLLLVIGTFWSVQKKRYWLVALFIGLASATRVTGILLLPAVLFEIVMPKLDWRKNIKPIGIVSLGSLGLVGYMYYLYKDFGDPLYFFHVQEEFGGVRQENLITYPQVAWRYIKILLTARPFDLKYFSYVQDFIVSTVGLIVILYAATKTRLSYVIFALSAFLVPTLTGTFSSMPRYILVCFPLYILLGIWAEKSKIFRYTWLTISVILLMINTILFIQGYWVA